MGEALYHHHHHQQQQQQQQQQLLLHPHHHHHPPSAAAAAAAVVPQQQQRAPRVRGSAAGEIVEVQGGHIVRSTGRKDRHSKVCTAKGPRDRRVRLSAHTAIQFYDVQDRLGYDRPSKAVDWLIKNAKSAIDELAELPPWHPSATTAATSYPPPIREQEPVKTDSGKKAVTMGGEPPTSSSYYGSASSFLPPSLESDAIADTIKFLFPISGVSASSSTPPMAFQNYPPDLLSRSSSQTQDLRLSLQSFEDPILLHHHSQPTTTTAAPHLHLHQHNPTNPTAEQAHFSSSSTPIAFDAAGWSEQNSRMMVQWSSQETGGGGAGGGYMFNMPVQPPQGVPLHQLLGQGPFLAQRGPLQSNSPQSVRQWSTDPSATLAENPTAMAHFGSTIGLASGGGFSGFRFPARIQREEEQGGMSDKPSSSASPGSHH